LLQCFGGSIFTLRFFLFLLVFGFKFLVGAINHIQRPVDDLEFSTRAASHSRFVTDSRSAGEKKLADVGEGCGIPKRDAVVSDKNQKIAEDLIHGVVRAEVVEVADEFFGDIFGVNILLFLLGVGGAEDGASGEASGFAAPAVGGHVLAAGIVYD
jgi:hypothetical protein